MPLPISLVDFDVASQPGMRTALGNAYARFKQQQSDSQAPPIPHLASVKRSRCPNCQASIHASQVLFIKNAMPHARCDQCALVYSHVILDHQADAALYDNTAFMRAHLQLKREPLYAHLEVTKAQYFLQHARQFSPSARTVLDIGASSGAVMLAAKQEGLTGYGIEPNSAIASDLAAIHGEEFCSGYFPQDMPAHWPRFDIITLLDVLEHIAEPLTFLSAIKSTMQDQAVLVVQVPNLSGLFMQLEGQDNANYCAGHWQHFTSVTLENMLGRAGFKALAIGNCISELDRILAFDATTIRSVLQQHLGKSIPLTPDALYEHQLGYKLYGVFQPVTLSSSKEAVHV